LWGQELRFRLNAEALCWLEQRSLPAPLCTRLVLALPWERDLTSAELSEQLRTAGIKLGRQQLQQIGDALALAAYHAQTRVPIVAWLLSDDATVYDHLSEGHGRCWVHDWRHYAKLRPVVASHLRALQAYRKDYWELYRALLKYREAPSDQERARLSGAFESSLSARRATTRWMRVSARPPTSARRCWQCWSFQTYHCTTTTWSLPPDGGCANAM